MRKVLKQQQSLPAPLTQINNKSQRDYVKTIVILQELGKAFMQAEEQENETDYQGNLWKYIRRQKSERHDHVRDEGVVLPFLRTDFGREK